MYDVEKLVSIVCDYLDAMSAIICVIDYEKFKRGLGV